MFLLFLHSCKQSSLAELGQQGRCQHDQRCKTKERQPSLTSLIQRIHWPWPLSHQKSQVTRLVSLMDKTLGRCCKKKPFRLYSRTHNLKYLWSSQYQVSDHKRADSFRLRDYMSHEIVWIKDRIGHIVCGSVVLDDSFLVFCSDVCFMSTASLTDEKQIFKSRS